MDQMEIAALRLLLASFLFVNFASTTSNNLARHVSAQDISSAERLPPSESTSNETEYLSCWKRGEKEIKSRLVRSPILISPDGLYRAHVEVQATALKPKDEATYAGRLCFNDSTLFVEGPGGKSFKVVYSDPPKVLDGNSIKLIDWAPDGKSLLVEAAQWEYESEGIYTEFFIFTVDSRAIAEPDLMTILAARFGKDCWSENTVLGFTPGGAVIVAVKPDTDEVGLENGAISCVNRKTVVAIDLAQAQAKSVQVLPPNTKVSHNGTYAPSTAQK
jgi:hypothetical protein